MFGQLGIQKKYVLLQTNKFLNVCIRLLSFTTLEHYKKINCDQFAKFDVSNYVFLNSNQYFDKPLINKLTTSNNHEYLMLCKHRTKNQKNISSLTEPILSNSIYDKKPLQLLIESQDTKDDKNDTNTFNLHKSWTIQYYDKCRLTSLKLNTECNLLYNIQVIMLISNNAHLCYFKRPTSIILKPHYKKCKGLQEINYFGKKSSNSEYKFRNPCNIINSHRIVYLNSRKLSSSSEIGDAKTNPKSNDDENAKKIAKDAEDKIKRMKEINDDHVQTIAQLEVLKAQVKKVHEEMQTRKHESWTIKMGKLINSIGSFLTKIGPTMRSILSMGR